MSSTTVRRRASTDVLSAPLARLLGFTALAGFGALQWAGMLRPAATGTLLASVAVAAFAGLALSALARRRAALRVRVAATLVAAGLLLAVVLASAGVPRELLGPRGWDELASGIGQGLGAVSTVRTPYGGADEWTRLVLVLGGCLLTALAALLAFAPRRGGRFGFPTAAAVVLGALYTIPVMQHDVRLPFLAGLAFTLLLATFLWLERVERRSATLAAATVAVAAFGGWAAAPALDGDRALLDYEELAQSLSPSAVTQYRWDHDYGVLDWPRDGREVLRVRSAERSYWKAVNLSAFDGRRWVRGAGPTRDPIEDTVYEPKWRRTIGVTLRALRTEKFVAAGSTLDILDSPRPATSNTAGVYESAGAALRRGHAYRADVYVPRPSTARLRAAGGDYPERLPREYTALGLPDGASGAASLVVFGWWDEGAEPYLLGGGDARAALAASPYAEVYALARRLRAGAGTSYEYLRAVERHIARGARYTEVPKPSRWPLASFLLGQRAGYCQQFSGAMALLLRMGGIPARVATGFSPGVIDATRREYVVRDVDAHSWVELFAPRIGWVTRDPTPARSPARNTLADVAGGGRDDSVTFGGGVTSGGSERALDRNPSTGGANAVSGGAKLDGGETGPPIWPVIALLAVAIGGAALLLRARRGRRAQAGADPELTELRRALARSGRVPPPQATLAQLARQLTGTPAQEYLQLLAEVRYGHGSGRPTRAQRAALRRELGAGLGAVGRLRAWWALPPRLRDVR